MSALPHLHGIVPPLATPLRDDETIDVEGLERLVEAQIQGGSHALWILGTTAKFDMVTDSAQRVVAETVAEVTAGRVPLVLNVSDLSTKRTLEKAKRFDDLPYEYYTALPTWYLPMQAGEIEDYFLKLADGLSRPLVIYNAPWVCNQLTLSQLRKLAEHPRIAGVKDVHNGLFHTLNWDAPERRRQEFTYLHGCDLIANSVAVGADGFVPAMGNAFPELCVALWDASRAGDAERAYRLQTQVTRIGRVLATHPGLACLEAACRHRGYFNRMLPSPLRSLNEAEARKVVDAIEEIGILPEPAAAAV